MTPRVETIAAQATPPGTGGIGIVRVSGPAVRTIAAALLGALPAPRHATFSNFLDANNRPLDQGVALFFPAPHSFTGEDVLELHAHGAPVVLDLLLQSVTALGARLARPGEFSERAFLNGKIDLAQAEAVADLIGAGSATAARSALRSLQGEFSARIQAIVAALIRLRTFIEAAIDFPEEEVDFLADARVLADVSAIASDLAALIGAAHQGALLQHGMTVVLAGAPNAGKSSLLNALAQVETAIVSATPGTTRDIVRSDIHLDGMPLHVFDTAGLRESDDAIEREGVARAKAAMARADRVLLVVDDTQSDADLAPLRQHLPAHLPHTVIRNKIDRSGRPSGVTLVNGIAEAALSAKTGDGLDHLRAHLKQCMGFAPAGEGTFMARRRHLDALAQAQTYVDQARLALTERRAGELAAEELRRAQHALGTITGEFTSDDLLGQIFSSFCIGK